MIGRSSASPFGRVSTRLALIAFPLLASPLAGQDGCRGWAASCAAVEVRADADGEHLILFAPNLSATAEDESAAGAEEERASIRSAGAASATSVATADDPGYMACDDAREWQAAARGLDEDEKAECDRPPVGALFILALPASLYLFGPDGDDPTVVGPDDPFPNTPASSPGADDEGDDGDDGAGQGPGDDGTYDDDGTSDDGAAADDAGDDASNDGGTTGSRDETSGSGDDGGSSGGDDGGAGAGGDSGNTGGGSPGPNDPYHPDVDDLPPISQVPEPISTTLFGLGLAGYAGVRLRRRRGAPADEAPIA